MAEAVLDSSRYFAGREPVCVDTPAYIHCPAPKIDVGEGRYENLVHYFKQLTSGDEITDPQTVAYIQDGGNIRLVIAELAHLIPKSEAEVKLTRSRNEFVHVMKKGAKARNRSDQAEAKLEEEYVENVVAKIKTHIDARTPDEALDLLQIPNLVKRASFGGDIKVTPESFASNHLAILMDILLKEHVKLRQAAFEHERVGRIRRVVNNRIFRISVASSLFTLSLIPQFGIVPTPEEWITKDIEGGLRLLTAGILGIDLPKVLGEKVTRTQSRRVIKERQERFSEDQNLCDMALLITYNSTRTGENKPGRRVTNRYATDDKAKNLAMLKSLDIEFKRLNNDPGGKPYNADQALAFVSHVTTEFQDVVTEILASNDDPTKQEELFLDLGKKLIKKDIYYLRHRIRTGRFLKIAKGGVSIIPIILFPGAANTISEAKTITGDTMGVVGGDKDQDADDDWRTAR